METNKQAVQTMAKIQESELKFENFGRFLMQFFMLDVTTQVMLAVNLLKLSKNKDLNDYYVIKGFHELDNHKSKTYGYRVVLEHSFKCKGCDSVMDATTNSFQGRVRSMCERCYDRSLDYKHDSVANQLYD